MGIKGTNFQLFIKTTHSLAGKLFGLIENPVS